MLAIAAVLSGCAALIYQLLWTRAIGLVLGHSLPAVATVVAIFMAGLGLGAALASRLLDGRSRDALRRLYARLECGIACFALLVPVALRSATPWLAQAYDPLHADAIALSALRLLASALALIVPTTLMGATLPALVAIAAPAARRLGSAAGALYAWNTAGAIAGSLGGALLLLPTLGMRGTLAAAAGLNLLAALVVWRSRTPEPVTDAGEAPAPPPKRQRKKEKATPEAAPDNLPLYVTLAAAVVAGFSGIANEVAWTRALVLLIGPTAYAFAFILTAVVAGIALGSAVAAALLPRLRRAAPALAAALLASALLSLLVTHQIGTSIVSLGEFVRANADHMDVLLRAELALVLVLLVPPAACAGAVFPLAARLVAERVAGAARPTGLVYAWNTAGAILGSLAAGFALLPAFGLERTLLGLAALQGLAGALLFLPPSITVGRLGLTLAAAAGLALAFTRITPWDQELLAGGVYKYAAYRAGGASVEETIRAGELVSYEEGALATVSVKRLGGTLSLAIDGKVDATSSGDMATQRLLAHVPMLLHPEPRRVMVIGLGSGVTAGAALSHPVERVDAVEILPEVVRAARRFAKANGDALDDPRLRLIVADGRNHVLLSRDVYDVIISEPSNPWMAGVSALFTRDFFDLAKRRLAVGGLFCQWAHIYNMGLADLKTVIAGFSDVFPDAALFLINEGDVLLVGGRGPLPFDRARLERRLTGRVATDLAEIGVVDPFVFASLYTLDPVGLRKLADGARRHSDDRPILEFQAPRAMHANTGRANAQLLIEAGRQVPLPTAWAEAVTDPTAAQLTARARMVERAGGDYWAFDLYAGAIAKDPRWLPALEGSARCAVRADRAAEAEKLLRALAASAAPVEANVALGFLLNNTGRAEEALAALKTALERDPRQQRGLILAAEIQEQAGNPEAMEGLARQALAAAPGDAEAEAFLASAALARGAKPAAIAIADRVLAREPNEARALQVAAFARADSGDRAGARRFLERLIKAEPDTPGHWANFGAFELEGKDYRAAARLFETAVDLNPGDERAHLGLREAGRGLGDAALVARADKFLKSRGL